MTIGSQTLITGIALAPMAGYTDSAMREISHRYGAEYAVTEMVSAKAVVYGDKKTFALARIRPEEGPVALQIFGSEPEIMAEGAKRLYEHSKTEEGFIPPVAIDVNMGCPVPKIFTNGEGSALMRSPALIEKIVSAIGRAVPVPVTVKLRAGIDPAHKNAVECALAAEAGGAAAVCIHGRTRVEMYAGKADREIIRKVKESLHIPVFANGDVKTGADALAILSETGADGVFVGRGAIGNPFLFSEIRAALAGRAYALPGLAERKKTALCQLALAVRDKGERVAVSEARKQIALYFKGFSGSAALRDQVNRALTVREAEEALSLVN